ncbi:MAG: hypothetical protein WBV82_27555 [Myxococcaceae bacterium]
MSAKRDKFTKGRRSKPVGEGMLMRKQVTSAKSPSRRHSRKQRDVSISGAARSVTKSPRSVPPGGVPKQRT